MPAESPVAIGLDLGTSSLKAVAVSDAGVVLARATRAYPTARPEPEAAEQDPGDWLRAIDEALAAIAASVPPARWGVLGLSAMLPTLVAADASGAPVHPAVTWEDGRAEPQAVALADRFGADRLYTDTGQQIDGRYLLPMYARLRARGVAPTWLLGAKDWLVWQYTGVPLTDPSTAAGFGAYRLADAAWDAELLETVDTPAVPPVVPSAHAVPLLASVAARWGCPADTPLVVGAADSVLGAYGMGVRAPGRIAGIAGTSSVYLGIVPSPTVDPQGKYLVTPTADGGWARETDLVATGSAFAWLAALLRLDGPADVMALAETAELADAPIVLPYVGPGEQGALWDPELVGQITGLTLRTTAAELALGLVAGIVLESARCVDALRAGATGPTEVVLGGSGATPFFIRCLADATGARVAAEPLERDHSAIGAALLAGRAVLGFADTATGVGAAVEPRQERRAIWAERFARHDRLRAALVAERGAETAQ